MGQWHAIASWFLILYDKTHPSLAAILEASGSLRMLLGYLQINYLG